MTYGAIYGASEGTRPRDEQPDRQLRTGHKIFDTTVQRYDRTWLDHRERVCHRHGWTVSFMHELGLREMVS
jgi:hypothetical protein